VLRLIGAILAAIPFFAGYLLILVDDRRRGLHDMIARTVVVHVQEVLVLAASPEPGDVARTPAA
jgi:uncharacterized RDD family membrane protein YckC